MKFPVWLLLLNNVDPSIYNYYTRIFSRPLVFFGDIHIGAKVNVSGCLLNNDVKEGKDSRH